MKLQSILVAAAIAGGFSIASAQDKPGSGVKVAEPNPGLLNAWLRQQSPELSKWDLGGQFRARFESKQDFGTAGIPGAADFRRVGGVDNNYLLLREKLHAGYTPVREFSIYVEGRNSSSHSDERSPDIERDFIDLHQAFITLGHKDTFPLTAKIGRQELNYGDERLIGSFDWNNIGRVFDAARARYENDVLWVDALVGRVIIPQDDTFNEANDYDILSGIYASTRKLIPKQETQLYFLARNVGEGSPNVIGTGLAPHLTGASPRDIYTVGMRIKSLPGEFGARDYDAEVAGQFGNFQFTPTSPQLDHQAFAAHVAGGYTFREACGEPRVGLEYNFASGDSDPTDGKHETFENLFPTNHKFYGYMDFFSWQNMHNLRATSSIKPLKKLTLQLDYHAFWLADENDFFYQANGAPRSLGGYGVNPGAGSYVGSEVDFIATYAIKPYAVAQAGYGHFFTGEYVDNSLAPVGGSTDADYVYLQFVFNF